MTSSLSKAWDPHSLPLQYLLYTLLEGRCVGYGKLLSVLPWSHDGREKTLRLWHAKVFNCSLAGYSPWGCKRVERDWATEQQRSPPWEVSRNSACTESCSFQGHECKSELVPSPAMEPDHLPVWVSSCQCWGSPCPRWEQVVTCLMWWFKFSIKWI